MPELFLPGHFIPNTGGSRLIRTKNPRENVWIYRTSIHDSTGGTAMISSGLRTNHCFDQSFLSRRNLCTCFVWFVQVSKELNLTSAVQSCLQNQVFEGWDETNRTFCCGLDWVSVEFELCQCKQIAIPCAFFSASGSLFQHLGPWVTSQKRMFAIGVSLKPQDHATILKLLGTLVLKKMHVVFCLYWHSSDRTQTQSRSWHKRLLHMGGVGSFFQIQFRNPVQFEQKPKSMCCLHNAKQPTEYIWVPLTGETLTAKCSWI